MLRRIEWRVRRRRRIWAAAGGIAVLAILGAAVWRAQRIAPIAPSRPSSVVVVQPARRTLPDGSVVDLKGDAKISVSFGADARWVVLERGTAYFQVAGDPARPFVVRSGGMEVRAVGTAFAVQFDGGRQGTLSVLVAEGRVALQKAGSGGGALAMVGAGNSAELSLAGGSAPAPVLRSVPAAELLARLDWRVPRLEFSGTPLGEAIPAFNRYSKVKLVLADPLLAHQQISGILRADNIEAFLRLLQTDFGVICERRGDDQVILSRGR